MNSSLEKTAVVLATWFGCGRSPRAPGTVGTLGAIPLVWVMNQWTPIIYMAGTLVFCVAAIFVAQIYEDVSGAHDAPELVIDEVAGFLVTMTWLPFTWSWLLLGFLVFRLLDILKPFPISWVDRRMPGGIGAIADDIVAGILGNIILQWVWQNGVWP